MALYSKVHVHADINACGSLMSHLAAVLSARARCCEAEKFDFLVAPSFPTRERHHMGCLATNHCQWRHIIFYTLGRLG